jgi:hypothetical protein
MSNPVFWKAIRLLAHPAYILALATLLINDHLLRRLWPSWWTGKLGDFAWLFFMPFVAAALIALFAGRRARGRWVGALACLLVGGVFALAKTIPAAHAVVVGAASALFGFPVGWRRDPTDLIALVSVVAAWRLWDADERRRARSLAGNGAPHAALRAVPMLAAAVVLTVANSPAPERGIVAVVPADDLLVACSTYGAYASTDRGMSWTLLAAPTPIPHPTLPEGVTPTAGPAPTALPTATVEPGRATPIPFSLGEACSIVYVRYGEVVQGEMLPPPGPTSTKAPTPLPGEPTPTPGPTPTPSIYLVRDASNAAVYRFQPDNWIEHSEDGGRSWTRELTLGAAAEASKPKTQPGGIQGIFEAGLALLQQKNASFAPGPLGGMVDPASGNAIFSMGMEGVLVRDVEGHYRWVPVGSFQRGGP